MYYHSIDQIRRHNREIGHYFFDPHATRGFNSRILSATYGGRYFVTSERYDDSTPRYYTVRECVDGRVNTVSEFQQFATAKQAQAFARQLAAREEN